MMNKAFVSLLCVALSCIAIPGCKKSDTSIPPDRYALLTRGKWLLAGATVYTSAGTKDNFSSAMPCIKDNTFTFGTDGYILEDEGPSKCDTAYPQQRHVQQWSLRDDGRLNWNDGNIVWFYDINQLDSNLFIIQWEGDDPYTYEHHRNVLKYRHQ